MAKKLRDAIASRISIAQIFGIVFLYVAFVGFVQAKGAVTKTSTGKSTITIKLVAGDPDDPSEDPTTCIEDKPDDEGILFINHCKHRNMEVDVCGVRSYGEGDSELTQFKSERTHICGLQIYHDGLTGSSLYCKIRSNFNNPDTTFVYSFNSCVIPRGSSRAFFSVCPAKCPGDPSGNKSDSGEDKLKSMLNGSSEGSGESKLQNMLNGDSKLDGLMKQQEQEEEAAKQAEIRQQQEAEAREREAEAERARERQQANESEHSGGNSLFKALIDIGIQSQMNRMGGGAALGGSRAGGNAGSGCPNGTIQLNGATICAPAPCPPGYTDYGIDSMGGRQCAGGPNRMRR